MQLLNLNLDSSVVLVGLVLLLIAAARASSRLSGQTRRQLIVAISLLILSVLLAMVGSTVQHIAVSRSVGASREALASVGPIVSLLFLARVFLLLASVAILAFLVIRSGAGPEEEERLHKWSWGAFALAPIWGVFNRVYVGLLALVPILGFYVAIYLGIHGKNLAWNRSAKQSADFDRKQALWDRAGIVGLVLVVALALVRFWPF